MKNAISMTVSEKTPAAGFHHRDGQERGDERPPEAGNVAGRGHGDHRDHARDHEDPAEIEIDCQRGEDGVRDRERAENDQDSALERIHPPVGLERIKNGLLKGMSSHSNLPFRRQAGLTPTRRNTALQASLTSARP